MLPMMATMANTTATVNFRTKNCFGILFTAATCLLAISTLFHTFLTLFPYRYQKNRFEQEKENTILSVVLFTTYLINTHSHLYELQTDQRFRVQWTTIAFLDHVLWTFHIFRNTSYEVFRMNHVRQIQFHRCARPVLFLFSFPALCTTV